MKSKILTVFFTHLFLWYKVFPQVYSFYPIFCSQSENPHDFFHSLRQVLVCTQIFLQQHPFFHSSSIFIFHSISLLSSLVFLSFFSSPPFFINLLKSFFSFFIISPASSGVILLFILLVFFLTHLIPIHFLSYLIIWLYTYYILLLLILFFLSFFRLQLLLRNIFFSSFDFNFSFDTSSCLF